MFKVESVITPIILSYVDKYIKNLRPEDSQVSLWGGDVSFHNLDLRLEVLEQELQLPFSFVSGHIHELLIHVPWTKLISEPIIITINTIECILKLNTEGNARSAEKSSAAKEKPRKSPHNRQAMEAPPGYVQQTINKIVSNIRIHCNNLILKYVEEDIVLSMNVKLLTVESANGNWKSAYTEVNEANNEVIIRKIITVNDLTVCLDKRNASGKIDVYQEPMLYRCSMILHFFRNYHSISSKKCSTTRLDISCSSMEFSMTEQQIPMLLRLLFLLHALQQKQLKSDVDLNKDNEDQTDNAVEFGVERQTFGGWALSFVPYMSQTAPEDPINDEQCSKLGHTLHIGFYVDNASLTFKVCESSSEKGTYYSQKKIKYWPLLTFRLQGIFSDMILHGKHWTQVSMGISQMLLIPIGHCSCSLQDVFEESPTDEYLKAGCVSEVHKSLSLFDVEAPENKSQKKIYNTNWDHHIEINNEAALLERSPSFAIDYLYQVSVPDDMTSESLSELGSDLEYSNLSERALLRVVVGSIRLKVCSGLLHRIGSIQAAALAYDYVPYSIPKPEPDLKDLAPASQDEYEALEENIPTRLVQVKILSPVIELQLMDHHYFKPTKNHLFNKRTKSFLQPLQTPIDLPIVVLQCKTIEMNIKNPMYYKRLVRTACMLPDPPKSFCCRLLISKKHITILTPSSCSYHSRKILIPEYWINPNIPHEITTFESEGISLTGTNPKFVIVAYIIDKIIKMDCEDSFNYIIFSSILQDALKNEGLVYLEFCIEDIFFKKVITSSTVTYNTRLGSIKAFIFEPIEIQIKKPVNQPEPLMQSFSTSDFYYTPEIQQVLIISGPEADTADPIFMKDQPLFTATLQFPLSPEKQTHPPILLFDMKEIRICIDPLLCKWLLYKPRNIPAKTESLYDLSIQRKLSRSYSEMSVYETPRKCRTPHESIHSSLEQSTWVPPKETVNQEKKRVDEIDFQERVYCFLKNWLDVWKGLLICGDIAPCTIYFPVKSLSALGAQGIQSALVEEMKKEFSSDIFIITLPSTKIRNSAQKENLAKYTSSLPVILPDHIWNKSKCSFPWNIEVSNFSCFTWQNGKKLICLSPVFLTSTVGMSTKTNKSDIRDIYDMNEQVNFVNFTSDNEDIETLGICVHIDMKPIVLKISEVQVCLIASILHGLVEVISNIIPDTPPQQEVYKPSTDPAAALQDSTVSPSLLKESLDTMSEKSPRLCTEDLHNENIKLTAWIQWTIQRFSIELRAFDTRDVEIQRIKYNNKPNLKFVVDAEDIVSSLDFQSVYLKLKSKVGSVSIMHFQKDKKGKWVSGDFLGLVMRINEEYLNSHVPEDTSFANITVTRASCQHTHNLWGKSKKTRNSETILRNEPNPSRYITEIVVKLQPIDVLISPTTLKNYFLVLEPLFQIPGLPKKPKKEVHTTNQINNRTLPLTYLEFQGFRIIMPSVDLQNQDSIHDTIIFQVKQISLAPTAVNPICRMPCRPDLYQRAAEARILNIPGSDMEDRQYQLDILEVSLHTGTWKEIKEMIIFQGKTAYGVRTMSENPALEWNSLGKAKQGCPEITFWPLIQNFNIIAVAAPAMIYKRDVICGHSVEVNFTSDIKMTISLSQIKLFHGLIKESSYAVDVLTNTTPDQRMKIISPYLQYNPDVSFYEEKLDGTSFDITRDSGFETSDLRSTSHSIITKENFNLRKMSNVSEKTNTGNSESVRNVFINNAANNHIPVDVLITAGNMSLALYDYDTNKELALRSTENNYDVESEQGYEASEEGSLDENINIKKFSPLVFLLLAQPNVYFTDSVAGKKFQASCFDVRVKINKNKRHSKGIPNEEDFCISVLNTKSGPPHPETGVFPAFFTLKWSTGVGKPTILDLEISKPTKLLFTISRYNYLLQVQEKLLQTFNIDTSEEIKQPQKDFDSLQALTPKSITYYSKFKEIKDKLMGISICKINISQIMLTIQTDKGVELIFSFAKLYDQLSISNRPEKLVNTLNMDGITLGILKDNELELILKPWSFSTELTLFWETWQCPSSNPQILVSAESDCLIIDISPDNILSLQSLNNDITEFCNNLPKSNKEGAKVRTSIIKNNLLNDREQYYKDDLRAGAFQFVDSNSINIDELPSPYQVMFWNRKVSAMAWRYPQPRALRKIKVFPVPFKISTGNEENEQILCHLEYWSECRGRYQPYTQFYLSEISPYYLDLPKHVPQPAVACTWRVVLTAPSVTDIDQYKILISPQVLAGCLRVDSYFNKNLIPDITLALHAGSININILNYFKYNTDIKLPKIIKDYTVDFCLPEHQQVLTFTIDNLNAYLATWNFNSCIIEINATSKCTILDYAFLTQHMLIEPFTSKLEAGLFNSWSVNYISQPMHFRFGASAAHTLSVTAQLWNEHLNNNENSEQNLILVTRYLICNDTNLNIIFGQSGIEEILLQSRHCHLYSWRSQKCKQVLRVALENSRWEWSEQFSIDIDGTATYQITTCSTAINVTVNSVSATQKKITFSGQFVICNTLMEHFEMKIVEDVETDKDRVFKAATTHVLLMKSTPPSQFIDQRKKYFLRLRFFGLDSAWSGDIPLMENNKCAQPWLVKVPLQERAQFLSIWCRIVVQNYSGVYKILAVLWPLFMIRSNLPVSGKVNIITPMLNVAIDSQVSGLGECQQLYCPGTIDHSHSITFQLDHTPSSNPSVPLNYSLVDQKLFFKKAEFEDIDHILSVIGSHTNLWPFFKDDLEGLDYLIEKQPTTHVQVRYQSVYQYASSLMVEFSPWCLLLNTLGCSIAIIVNDNELCRIKHLGLVTPPKLEEAFYIGVGIAGTWNKSWPLQLAKSNWSQAFYMPLINGSIPLEGAIKTVVKCDSYVSVLSIVSSTVNDIRLLKVGSSHVITNHTNLPIQVMCFAVPDNQRNTTFPEQFKMDTIALPPYLNKSNSGVPIIQWYYLRQSDDDEGGLAFYISLTTSTATIWSSPVRVDKYVARRTTIIRNRSNSIPLVIVAQEYKGQIFLSIHHDSHPQLKIFNSTSKKLFFAQYNEQTNIVKEIEHFQWIPFVDSEKSTYYTLPRVSEKYPELLADNCAEYLTLAAGRDGDNYMWSAPINIANFNEQFVCIPCLGDVKVAVKYSIHSIEIYVHAISHVEVRAKDIRGRLKNHEIKSVRNSKDEYIDLKISKNKNSVSSSYYSSDGSIASTSSDSLSLNQFTSLDDTFESNTSLSEYNKEDSTNHPRKKSGALRVMIFIKGINIVLTSDLETGGLDKPEILSLTCDDVTLSMTRDEISHICLGISEVQVDNQLYSRGCYDFPVLLIGQESKPKKVYKIFSVPILQLVQEAQNKSLIKVELNLETWRDDILDTNFTEVRDINVSIDPISVFIEDVFIMKLLDHVSILNPSKLVIWPEVQTKRKYQNQIIVAIPEHLIVASSMIARPLILQEFTITPMNILLSIHSSIKMYIALDQSPLQFGQFDKRRVFTTNYRLGHALAMHYLSGAIFGAGWVVGSLELLGSPGGLARAMGTGLRDFVTLPYYGLIQGPWAFLVGISYGSASLMKHVTAGTLHSVTKLASSVARNLDRLTLDQEHLRRTEELRRRRPQGITQGLIQGLTSLGISLLGAVSGIAHHPLQSVVEDGASPSGLLAGVGKGIVGVFTKPLSGAAELVALTGQGLLQGAGWTNLPEPRMVGIANSVYFIPNSFLKYQWKFIQKVTQSNILFVIDAMAITSTNQLDPVALVLATDVLIIVDIDEDIPQRLLSLSELTGVSKTDPTLLCLKLDAPRIPTQATENIIEMDAACRARVVDYVRSTFGMLQIPDNVTSEHSDMSISPNVSARNSPNGGTYEETYLSFYVNPHYRNYFLGFLALAKQQHFNYNFPVL